MSAGSVLVVSSHFPPRQVAGVYRTLRFVRGLADHGWSLHVLTMDPASYEPQAKLDAGLEAKVPAGVAVYRTRAVRPLEWVQKPRGRRQQAGGRRQEAAVGKNGRENGGLRMADGGAGKAEHRTSDIERPTSNGNGERLMPNVELLTSNGNPQPSTLNPQPSLWQRLKDAITVPLMTPDREIGWLPFAVRRGKRVIRQHGIDVIYSSGPPWTNHLVGLKLARATGRPWLADFRDPWVGNNFRPNRRGETWAGRKHQRLEREVVETAARVILNTERSRDEMCGRYPELPASKFVVIPNGYQAEDFFRSQESVTASPAHPLARSSSNHSDSSYSPSRPRRLVMAHAGSFYGRRNVSGLIAAVGQLCEKGRVPRERLEIRLIGAKRPGRNVEREQIARAGVGDIVKVLQAVPHDECLRELAAADVLLLVQTEAPLCVPGKVFEYIAIGKPVFTLTGEGATADLVRQERLGACVDPDDVPAIETALARLYDRFAAGDPLDRPSPETQAKYDGRRLTGELDTLLRDVLGARVDG